MHNHFLKKKKKSTAKLFISLDTFSKIATLWNINKPMKTSFDRIHFQTKHVCIRSKPP